MRTDNGILAVRNSLLIMTLKNASGLVGSIIGTMNYSTLATLLMEPITSLECIASMTTGQKTGDLRLNAVQVKGPASQIASSPTGSMTMMDGCTGAVMQDM